jgi:hypothetical protein
MGRKHERAERGDAVAQLHDEEDQNDAHAEGADGLEEVRDRDASALGPAQAEIDEVRTKPQEGRPERRRRDGLPFGLDKEDEVPCGRDDVERYGCKKEGQVHYKARLRRWILPIGQVHILLSEPIQSQGKTGKHTSF